MMRPVLAVTVVMALAQAVLAPPASAGDPFDPPIIYFSSAPNACANIEGTTYHAYMWSPGVGGITGASFEVEFRGNAIVQQPVLVVPAPGVTINSLDTSTLVWRFDVDVSAGSFDHEPLLTFTLPSQPFFDPDVLTRNVEFRFGATTLVGPDVWSYGCCVDCFICFTNFNVTDRQLVIGRTTTFAFQWQYFCFAIGGGDVTVTDTEGWTDSWDPLSAGGGNNCGACVVPYQPGSITMTIPAGVTQGTTSIVTISNTGGGSGTFEVEAVNGPVPVEATTWGAIKALYR